MQKNVYGASVIIFEGIMSFADKELLEVRLFVWFKGFFWSPQAAEVNIPVSVSPSVAAGHENLRGHRLRHPAGPSAPQGHLRAGPGHRRRHQAVQQVCEAGFWAVHWTHHEAGGHCCAQRWDYPPSTTTTTYLFLVPSSFALRMRLIIC